MTRIHWLGLAALLIIALGVGGYFQVGQQEAGRGVTASRAAGGETKAVRLPDRFPTFGAQMSYIVALKYPQLLDSIYCYCKCDRPPSNHKSLLSCFTDYHALK
jgi:hypothetical protein